MKAPTDAEWVNKIRSGGDNPGRPKTRKPKPPAPETRRKHGISGWLAAASAVASVVAFVFGDALTGAGRPAPATHPAARTLPAPVTASPPPPPGAAADLIGFRAHADCPPGGSTSAEGLANTANPTPWICARRTEGQPLHITLLGPGGAESNRVITGISIIPGDIGQAVDGRDPWLAHRCVNRVMFDFNNVPHTPPVSLDTGCAHGEAFITVPSIIASRITVIVNRTARPPAPTEQTSAPTASGDDGDLIKSMMFPTLGPTADQDEHGADPSDGTFAVGGLKIMGAPEAAR